MDEIQKQINRIGSELIVDSEVGFVDDKEDEKPKKPRLGKVVQTGLPIHKRVDLDKAKEEFYRRITGGNSSPPT